MVAVFLLHRIKIYPQSDGTILEVLVREGDLVSRGQELFALSTSRASNRSTVAGIAAVDSLYAEESALIAQIEREKDSFIAQIQAIEDVITGLTNRLRLAREQEALAAQRRDIAQNNVDRLSQIKDSRYVSAAERDRATGSVVDYELRQKELQLEIDAIQSEISRQRHLRSQIPNQRDVRLAELMGESARVSQRVADSLAKDNQMIVATSAGRVSGLSARRGQTVSSAYPVLSLIPDKSIFYVELLVPSRSIGFVKSDAEVNMRFDAYPHQKFGVYGGKIDHVARTIIMPGEIPFPVVVSEPAYLVTVTLDSQYISAYGEEQDLQAGMTLSADILRDKRRLIEWVFDPLLSSAKRL